MPNEVTYTPREKAPQGTRVTSWWIDGSRDRYGEAYFISEGTLFTQSGGEVREIILWRNQRPYAPNVQISKTAAYHRPETWAEIDRMMTPREPVRFDPFSGNA